MLDVLQFLLGLLLIIVRDAGCGFLWSADSHHFPQACCLLHIDAVLMKLERHACFLIFFIARTITLNFQIW
jgi:hypothetical protein